MLRKCDHRPGGHGLPMKMVNRYSFFVEPSFPSVSADFSCFSLRCFSTSSVRSAPEVRRTRECDVVNQKKRLAATSCDPSRPVHLHK